MHAITIKRAGAGDAERLTALVRSSGAYTGMYASIVSDYVVTVEYIARHHVFVAVDATDRLLGCYALVSEPPELDLAFVADDAQGLGVGRLLVEHMLHRARATGLAEVRVVSHPPAEEFYRRMGAERIGTVAPTPPKVTWQRPELRFTLDPAEH
ncbi:GNAT family N-acetyltransferase [Embleya sp. NPDC008237]|uniref:GNAT family N-acetyltransferase n=1 Tax=Embleya sp. NPDC008237 TaxID=3363978 RepID=UPI0036E595CE